MPWATIELASTETITKATNKKHISFIFIFLYQIKIKLNFKQQISIEIFGTCT